MPRDTRNGIESSARAIVLASEPERSAVLHPEASDLAIDVIQPDEQHIAGLRGRLPKLIEVFRVIQPCLTARGTSGRRQAAAAREL
ncbi:hypothetical protein ABIA39_004005 [Nocardia sp. GAS34]|uniref:hypothetical protein n=1 Tax=unclassified Nocardia TaxID=2637762 RepID=UPI003D1C4060